MGLIKKWKARKAAEEGLIQARLQFNRGEIDHDQYIEKARSLGFDASQATQFFVGRPRRGRHGSGTPGVEDAMRKHEREARGHWMIWRRK